MAEKKGIFLFLFHCGRAERALKEARFFKLTEEQDEKVQISMFFYFKDRILFFFSTIYNFSGSI
jgi:hypothetical protein